MRTRSNLSSADILIEQAVLRQVLENNRRFQATGKIANSAPTPDHAQDDPSNPINFLRPGFHTQNPALLPAIRLYMHLVELALPIFHTMIHRAATLLPRESPTSPRTWDFENPLDELTSEQTAHTSQYLGRLGKVIDWVLDDAAAAGTQGITSTRKDRPLKSFGLLGVGSTITISADMVSRIDNAHDMASQQWASFELALLMLHELVHAVEYAVLPYNLEQQVFLGPAARTTEIGFEVEAMIFGGRLSLHDGQGTSDKVMLSEWPDAETAQDYRDAGQPIQLRGTPKQMKRSWSMLWKVDLDFLEGLFEDQYWAEEVASQGMQALRPQTRVGRLKLSRRLTDIEEESMKSALGLEAHELADILNGSLARVVGHPGRLRLC